MAVEGKKRRARKKSSALPYTIEWLPGLAARLAKLLPTFDQKQFLTEVEPELVDKTLKQRVTATARVLGRHLPKNYVQAIGVLRSLSNAIKSPMSGMFIPEFIGLHGLQELERSMGVLKQFNQIFPAEYGVRRFFTSNFAKTMEVMHIWSLESDPKTRRLAVLASRPLLPEAAPLKAVKDDRKATWPLIEALHMDPSPMVRRAVGDHLSDLIEIHPEWTSEELGKWDRFNPRTSEIIDRAIRIQFKARNPVVYFLKGFEPAAKIKIEKFELSVPKLTIGGRQGFSFQLVSEAAHGQKLAIDFRIHYLTRDGDYDQKIFRIGRTDLGPKARQKFYRKKAFRSTPRRALFPGKHTIEILVNGVIAHTATFTLIKS